VKASASGSALASLAALAAACATDVHEITPLPAPPIELAAAQRALDTALTTPACGKCIVETPRFCAELGKFPLVAAVAGARMVRDLNTCAHIRHLPGPNDSYPCAHFTALRFDEVSTLSKGDPARGDDLFRISYSHDIWTPGSTEGVSLAPGKRYVVFAYPGANAKPHANWDVGAACEF